MTWLVLEKQSWMLDDHSRSYSALGQGGKPPDEKYIFMYNSIIIIAIIIYLHSEVLLGRQKPQQVNRG